MADFLDDVAFTPEDPLAVERVIEPMESAERYRKMFDESRQAAEVGRMQAELCRDYYDDKQLSRKAKTLLRKRGQPETIRNRIKPAVNGILGILQQRKVDPRGLPRNPQDEDAADVCSKVLRYIADSNRFHSLKIDAADNHIVEGIAAAIVDRADPKTKKIPIIRIPYSEYFYDPRSRDANFADASYMGIAKWMFSDNVARMYPDYAPEIRASVDGTWSSQFGAWDSTWDDRPDNLLPWVDAKKKRLMVVEMYHQEGGKWHRCVFFAAGVLESGESPYLDENDEPCCPIEASSCYIDRDNRRYGVVQSMLFLQDEINARASRALHLTNTRQVEIPDPVSAPPTASADEARSEASKADGVLPWGYRVVPTTDMATGNLALLSDAKTEIDRQAPTPAVLGQASSGSSGRSKQVSEQAGLTELARPLGRLEDWENRIYRACWCRARQDWDDAMWIRVTDEEDPKKQKFLRINEPVMGPVPQPVIDPQTGQPAVDPMTGQPMMQMGQGVTEIKNRIADMDMDIEIETVPATANLDAETFEALLNQAPLMAQAYGPKATFDALMIFSPSPQKARVREILEKGAEEQQQQQQAAQQQAMQAQQAAMQAQQQRDQVENAETAASAQAKQADAQRTQIESQRLMLEPIVPPENELM